MRVKLMSASFQIIADGPDRGKMFFIGQEYDEADVPEQYRELFLAAGDQGSGDRVQGKKKGLEIVRGDEDDIKM